MSQFGGKDSKRHFTVVMGGKEHGLYVSSTPSSAAKKAVTKLCAANKSKKVEFEIREITQGFKKKTYGPYEGHIEKLKEPIELKGRVIKYKPVTKLSGKSGVKKGGMRGVSRECYDQNSYGSNRFRYSKIRGGNETTSTLNELRAKKATFTEMRDAGFKLKEIWTSPGYSSQDLIKPAGFTLKEVLETNLFTPDNILSMEYELGKTELQSAGFNKIADFNIPVTDSQGDSMSWYSKLWKDYLNTKGMK